MKFTIYAKREKHGISIWAFGNNHFYCLHENDEYHCNEIGIVSYFLTNNDFDSYAFWNDSDTDFYIFDIKDYDMLVKEMVDTLKTRFKIKLENEMKEKEVTKQFKKLKKVHITI